MLEPPAIPQATIIAHLRQAYPLPIQKIEFLPIGWDSSTAVFRAQAEDGGDWFVKLRQGPFDSLTVEIPWFLVEQGMREIIPPLRGASGALWTRMGTEYTVVVYPFIEGKDGYEVQPSQRQWTQFGAALRRIHAPGLPAALEVRLPREDFSHGFRDEVLRYQSQAETGPFYDAAAEAVAQGMRANRGKIDHLVARANELARALQASAPRFTLCHADIHAGNLHLTPGGSLYIVDWDFPMFGLKERDLGLIGGCGAWRDPQSVAQFYAGYHGEAPVEIDLAALTYYRFERILADLTAYGEQLFLTPEGGENRAQSVIYFQEQFEAGNEVDLAIKGDPG